MILIVDDHVDTAALLARLLKRCGQDALVVSSGYEALTLLKSTKPDVVVLDLRMPGMDGLDVLRAMTCASDSRDIPVIMYSAEADEMTREEAFRLGAKDYLVKGTASWPNVCATIKRYVN